MLHQSGKSESVLVSHGVSSCKRTYRVVWGTEDDSLRLRSDQLRTALRGGQEALIRCRMQQYRLDPKHRQSHPVASVSITITPATVSRATYSWLKYLRRARQERTKISMTPAASTISSSYQGTGNMISSPASASAVATATNAMLHPAVIATSSGLTSASAP